MERKSKVVVEQTGSGIIWIIGWLFTIGFVKLTFWQGVLGLLIWPYYLGDLLSKLMK